MNPVTSKTNDLQPLDAVTGGAFSAPTSGERAARVREWLSTDPSLAQMQDVFKELSARDKGAARPLREKLDELRRAKGQEALAGEWAEKAQALLTGSRFNIADALAWQRDAAKAGAPLSKEPLATLKSRLVECVKGVEDVQNQAMVQREASVLLAQRIEVLSTKSWKDAQTAAQALRADVPHWQAQANALVASPHWPSVDLKFPSQMESARAQLLMVWDAFSAALAQAELAAADSAAPLPPVPVWADELRVARGLPSEGAAKTARLKLDPAVRDEQHRKSSQAVLDALGRVEQEVGDGHGKASANAATALRNALREHGRHIDASLEARVHAALTAAGELEGWQRWRADQLREELVLKAEALFRRTGKDGKPLSEGESPVPALGGRKMQETLRHLREQWKSTDQGGMPNQALWKRFDDACNEAHKVVEVWLDKLKHEGAEHRAQRQALIEEVKAWTQRNAERTEPHEWKAFSRALHQLSERWREAGHLGEKAFAELQPQWKQAIHAAAAPLEAEQKASTERRQALIEEAKSLGTAPMLRIDAVRALQQRWQAEAQSVPMDRKFEQKLWDAFRKPIDDAFNRKTQEREKAAATLSQRDKVVLDAAQALEAANASGDAQKIRAAMSALDAALKGQALAQAAADVAGAAEAQAQQAASAADPVAAEPAGQAPIDAGTAVAAGGVSTDGTGEPMSETASEPVPAVAPTKPAAKPVIAMRGDDRPGMKKSAPVPAGRGGKFGDRKDGQRGPSRPGDNKFEPVRAERGAGGFGDRGARGDDRGGRFADRPAYEDRGPRLGDAAFRAQRHALENAEAALKKLAIQAHGEVVTQLLTAWEQRSADKLPSQQELGRVISPIVRGAWSQAVAGAPQGDGAEALLRLEMAAEAPTPAEHLSARRLLQLQLLTRRNDPAPTQTWGQDAAKVLASSFDAGNARRLQSVLKTLLRR